MHKLSAQFSIWVVVIATSLISSILTPNHSEAAGPWKGQIVAKDTSKPLEEVVVLAVWYKRYSSIGGWAGDTYYDSQETVTGETGKFTIASRQTWTLNPFSMIKGPIFYIFKPGYGRWQFQGEDRWSQDTFERQEQQERAWKQFEREGAVLELPRLVSSADKLGMIVRPGREIPSNRMRKYLEALDRARADLGLEPGYTK